MVTTHAVLGAALAAPLAWVAPDLAPTAALAGFAGGAAPDLDLVVGEHRRTLHFPVLGWPVAAAAAAAAAISPGAATAGVAPFLTAAALHAAMDAFGAGTELRPWERTSDRAVYDHLRGRWLRPRWVVRYDGAPEDVGLTLAGALPGLVLFDARVRAACAAAVGVAVVYAAVRRRVPEWFGWLIRRLGGP